MACSETTVKVIVEQLIHRLLHLVFHHHLQHDEVDAAVHIFAACTEARVFYILYDTVFEGVVQVEVAGHFGGETGFLFIGYEVGQILKVVADEGLCIEAYRMGSVLFATVKTSFITVFVDCIQLKVDCRDYARLVVEHFLYIQVFFIRAFQLRDILRYLIVERELLFVISFHDGQ